jgi:short-subunit dehydrogenase
MAAYVLSFGEALHVELRPRVSVTVLSPGLMDTGFNEASGYVIPSSLNRMELLPAAVAKIGLDAMFAGKSGVIAGRLNKIMAFSSRLLTRNFSAKFSFDPMAPRGRTAWLGAPMGPKTRRRGDRPFCASLASYS